VLAIVGVGGEHELVQRRARELGVLDRNFFMLGTRPKSMIPAILSAATGALSCFLPLPALHDNSPNKVFDALAAGRPVFVNHEGWLADLLRERECGLVMPRDPSEAAARLASKLDDPAWLARAGVAARILGRERFDRDVHARQLEAVLERAVEGGA
jgi:glycosyltransferase involved in cell wall biosynthesis